MKTEEGLPSCAGGQTMIVSQAGLRISILILGAMQAWLFNQATDVSGLNLDILVARKLKESAK